MKALNQFTRFDWEQFSKDKNFRCTGCSEWSDYNTKTHCGKKVAVVITRDDTQYKSKSSDTVTNLYEKLTFKCARDVQIPTGSYVVPVNPVAVVYGEYRNMLSIKCDDIKILQPTTTGGAK